MERIPVSAFIVTQNVERKIEACLDSLSWCEEIVVVDAFSTDRTLEICRRYTDRIVQRPWAGYRLQKTFAMEQTRNDWVLLIDSDEVVSPGLAREILSEFRNGSPRNAGYAVPRRSFYLGRWISHSGWYPDHKLRLFRKSRGGLHGPEPHERVEVDGPVGRLRGDLYHFSYDSVGDHLLRTERYATLYAEQHRWRPSDVFRMLVRPPIRFLQVFVLRLGFLDGIRGLIIAAMASYYLFLRYAKLYERHLRAKR